MRRKKAQDHGELRALPLFAHLDDETLDDIARAGRTIDHAPGDAIVTEGGMGLGFHVIVNGKAIVSVDGEELAQLGSGDFFGELALLSRTPRNATVAASNERVRTFSIDATDFRWLVEQHPTFATEIARVAEARRR